MRKLSIHSIGKHFIVFKHRPEFFKLKKARTFIYKHNGMRIAHRNTGHLKFPAADIYASVYNRFRIGNNRNSSRFYNGRAHINTYGLDCISVSEQLYLFHAAHGFDSKFVLFHIALVVNVSRNAAYTVAAHRTA